MDRVTETNVPVTLGGRRCEGVRGIGRIFFIRVKVHEL